MTTRPPVYYGDYLAVDELLATQRPESRKLGAEAHDEMLFIIVHQAYELWFKQILHEMDRIERDFSGNPVDGDALGRVVHGLERVHTILAHTIGQLDVLETMTPSGFLEFRDLLMPASGFQSLQFRLIETRLGLADGVRVPFDDKAVEERLSPADRERWRAARARPTVHGMLDAWLARTPFLDWGGATFREAYRTAVLKHLGHDVEIVRADDTTAPERRERDLRGLERATQAFAAIFEPEASPGAWRLSPQAVQAALFITVYRDMPALQQPARLLACLMDLDETLTLWRYRHALMVERMIGRKIGTGGSSGHSYLRQTAERHRVFADLFQLSTFLIPPASLPALPGDVRRRLGYVYAS